MIMKTRILSLLLVFLLVMSFAAPAVSAEPGPLIAGAAPAIPVVVDIVVDGAVVAGVAVTVVATVAVSTAVEIGDHLKKTWDGAAETLNNFASDVGASLSNLFAAKNWISATSHESAAMFEFEYFASGGAGGKKDDDDKWYHKAERDENGEVKVNTERISEKDAVKELRRGRDIFTSKKELAEKVVNRVSRENHKALKLKERFKKLDDKEDLELHHAGQKGYYEHYHPKYQHTRPHCWFWWR